jgi:hypothetical protein
MHSINNVRVFWICTITFSSKFYVFLHSLLAQLHLFQFSISYRTCGGDIFSQPLSGNVFNIPSFLLDSFAGYTSLGWPFFSFSTVKTCHSLLACRVSAEKLAVRGSRMDIPMHNLLFFFFKLENLLFIFHFIEFIIICFGINLI